MFILLKETETISSIHDKGEFNAVGWVHMWQRSRKAMKGVPGFQTFFFKQIVCIVVILISTILANQQPHLPTEEGHEELRMPMWQSQIYKYMQ